MLALAWAALAAAPSALADDNWLPHPADATWTYQWSDTAYAPTPTTEKVTVASQKGTSFVLAWTTDNLGNPPDAVTSNGSASFNETNSGFDSTDWSSTPPPATFPVLCPQIANCGNALSSTLYNVIWGSRQPVLMEPLLQGLTWTSTGGTAEDVSSTSTYIGSEQIRVPAFPGPVTAARVKTVITQAGALGDPYGSGTRTIWWVYGVGPVKIDFQHAGGGNDVTTSVLQSTSLTPLPWPGDTDYFPFKKGLALTYRWTNTKHLTKPEVEKFTIAAVATNTAQFTMQSVSGPIKVKGDYYFTKRLDGVTNLAGTTSSATTLKLPPLGPKSAAPAKRNHFVTPFDLMDFGFNPILPAYPAAEASSSWSSTKPSNDFTTYGVNGGSQVVGVQNVKVPAGTFKALVVRTTLTQPGFPYGSGTRTCWFAAGKGLVKLVFAHGDGSVSTVELIK